MKYDVVITYGQTVEAESEERAIEIAANYLTALGANDLCDMAECSKIKEAANENDNV